MTDYYKIFKKKTEEVVSLAKELNEFAVMEICNNINKNVSKEDKLSYLEIPGGEYDNLKDKDGIELIFSLSKP